LFYRFGYRIFTVASSVGANIAVIKMINPLWMGPGHENKIGVIHGDFSGLAGLAGCGRKRLKK
jgi:hypothetical protein